MGATDPVTAAYLKSIQEGAKQDASIAPASPEPDKSETNERQQLEIDRLKTELKALADSFARLGDIHIARLFGLAALFILVVIWLVAILVFVFLAGFQVVDILELSDPVILALIGSTTLNVLGLFTVAAKWLYGQEHKGALPEQAEE